MCRAYIKHFQFNFHEMEVVTFILTWSEIFVVLWALHHVDLSNIVPFFYSLIYL